MVPKELSRRLMAVPDGLWVPGSREGQFVALASLTELPQGSMRRATVGDVDLLLVHSTKGICVTEDRCPHMSAPLSIGTLEECVVGCPLHKGKFDLPTGDVVQFPTTGGLDADGGYHPPWTTPATPEKPEPTDLKAQARALTRVRRLRYYPTRIVGDTIEVQLPI